MKHIYTVLPIAVILSALFIVPPLAYAQYSPTTIFLKEGKEVDGEKEYKVDYAISLSDYTGRVERLDPTGSSNVKVTDTEVLTDFGVRMYVPSAEPPLATAPVKETYNVMGIEQLSDGLMKYKLEKTSSETNNYSENAILTELSPTTASLDTSLFFGNLLFGQN